MVELRPFHGREPWVLERRRLGRADDRFPSWEHRERVSHAPAQERRGKGAERDERAARLLPLGQAGPPRSLARNRRAEGFRDRATRPVDRGDPDLLGKLHGGAIASSPIGSGGQAHAL